MGKKQLGIQLQHSLACLTEAEMTGLDDACVNRAYRNLKEAFALRGKHFVFTMSACIIILGIFFQQRMKAFGKALMQHQRTHIGMSLRLEAEHIMQLALIPGSSRQQRSQRLIFQRTVRGKRSLQNIDITFFSIIEQAVDGQTAALQRFVCTEHSGQRTLAAVAADIGSTTQIFRFN